MAVYMIQAGGATGDVKIGFASDAYQRLVGLQCSHSEKLTIVRLFDGDGLVEQALHHRFAHLHKRGEWFRFGAELLATDTGYADIPIPLPKRRGGYRPCGAIEYLPLHLRLTNACYERVQAMAAKERRSVCQMLAILVEEAAVKRAPTDLAESPA
jgi:hypothetical protein